MSDSAVGPGAVGPPPPPEHLVLADVAAWRRWLDANEDSSDGVWLRLAKKGVTEPTSATYAEALDEALCSGWIDGQRKGYDETTFLQRFTPRRQRSLWSLRNLDLVAALIAQERMRARGHAEIARAKDDGRWDRAYAGQATVEIPEDLAAALAESPAALAAFAELSSSERYSVLHPVITAATPATREKRIARQIALLVDRAPSP
ncbi:YdeI family protein [Glaciihabitans sp. dw_435]|uniref:YdeI/OmpD-associated family protein n=1 Tax=Glaciihabitans sp. dw_435 TaxID=2720081 RepID=UPI001BD6B85E|nr:YdeI/OmpD-associated family protein [Glaciihabitans sp. dw_435]